MRVDTHAHPVMLAVLPGPSDTSQGEADTPAESAQVHGQGLPVSI